MLLYARSLLELVMVLPNSYNVHGGWSCAWGEGTFGWPYEVAEKAIWWVNTHRKRRHALNSRVVRVGVKSRDGRERGVTWSDLIG
ncbi:hypothetical protein ISN44_As08g003940 [Arabidopsis suecica]|uniref:Uncharacterized protein n=1 Tax=Arabidopsis suecica TaxID=45249 RepID=A0A8T2B334_ARASU|nr:hypothetical protein ISN44_As08g003940 [Arabidopsis suecica]